MHRTPRARLSAAVAALALTLALSAPTLAANVTQSTSETLTVLATTTLTGVPASIAYGSALTGATVAAPTSYTLVASSNNGAGFSVAWQPSDLTATGGTIAATARSLMVTNAGAGCSTVGALSGYSTAPGKPYIGPAGTAQAFVVSTGAGSCSIAGVKPHIAIPAGAVAGAYSGTSNFIVTETP